MPSFGFYIKDWRTIPRYRARSVGAFPIDNSQWHPEEWKPRYPNSAFRSARLDDKFWAARRLQAFTDDMLSAVIRVGQFNDPQSEEMLSRFLTERRNAIVRRYLPAVNPIVDLQLSSSGALTFKNAAVDTNVAAAPPEYIVAWRRFGSATADLGVTKAAVPNVTAPGDLPSTAGTHIWVDISVAGGPESWAPAHACFRREPGGGWKLVGFERMPGGNPPGTKDQRRGLQRTARD